LCPPEVYKFFRKTRYNVVPFYLLEQILGFAQNALANTESALAADTYGQP